MCVNLQATDDTRPPTDPAEARTFTTVVSDLERTYPKDKLDEISTSFCFICLLHLANEQGLKLEVEEEDMVEEVDEGRVGDIFGLKVSVTECFIRECPI
jgi:condensin complex subunit 2